MANYNQSTRARIGDIRNGLLVQSSKEVSYATWGVAQTELFTFYNRVAVYGLWAEIGATATIGVGALIVFNITMTVPAVGVAAISAASTTIESMATGTRISLAGVSAATVVNVDSAPGYSYAPAPPTILGIAPSATVDPNYGTIGCLTSIAVLTAGTAQFSILYAPIDPGAYVEALV